MEPKIFLHSSGNPALFHSAAPFHFFFFFTKRGLCSSAARVNNQIKPCFAQYLTHLPASLSPTPLLCVCLTGPSPACCRAGVQVSSIGGRRPLGCIPSILFPGPQTSVSLSLCCFFFCCRFVLFSRSRSFRGVTPSCAWRRGCVGVKHQRRRNVHRSTPGRSARSHLE